MRSLAPIQSPPQLAALRPLTAAIADRDVNPCRIFWWGDSVSEGATLLNDSFVASYRFQEMLRGAFPTLGVAGGRGYVPVYYESASLPATCVQDSSEASGGTPTFTKDYNVGLGARATQLNYGGALIFTGECTSFDVHYGKLEFGTNLQIFIDGILQDTVSCAKGSAGYAGGFVWTSPEVTPGTHVVRLKAQVIGGFESFIALPCGITWYYGDRGKGIHVYNAAKSGAAAHPGTAASFTAEHYKTMTTLPPAAVFVQLITNDAVFYTSPATYKTNLLNNFAAIQTAVGNSNYTLVGLTVPQPTGTFVGGALWPEYLKSMKEAIEQYGNGVFLNMSDFMGPTVAGDTLGLWSDGVHASRKGHALWADRQLTGLNLNGGGTTIPVSNAYQTLPFYRSGTLTVTAGKSFIYNDTGAIWTFAAARADVGTAPTGAGIVCAVKVNGATAFTIPIASGATTSGLVNPPTVQVPVGAKVSIDITQIGSTIAGADLSVTITTQSIV